ncbi:hypothetical protein HU200_058232 [Digitaria exilis]|uniref:Uncharacterized protein n=1 Tax=Digitaria exilis TaxID=1010633 RepID=A0A835AJV7_9POAL|nr:hypothetical protein HU200_058232 [Digitaria exilis]
MGEQGRPAPRDYIFDALGVLDERVWQALRSRILLAGEVNVLHARQQEDSAGSRLLVLFPDELFSRKGFEDDGSCGGALVSMVH